MIEREIVVSTRAGIHARPASLIAQIASTFKCSISIEKEDMKINAKSIMGIITLGATYKTKLKLITDGEDEKEASDKIVALFESKFEQK